MSVRAVVRVRFLIGYPLRGGRGIGGGLIGEIMSTAGAGFAGLTGPELSPILETNKKK